MEKATQTANCAGHRDSEHVKATEVEWLDGADLADAVYYASLMNAPKGASK